MDNSDLRSTRAPQAHLRAVPRTPGTFGIADQVVVVGLHGELTADSVPMPRAHLLTLVCDDGPDEIIVDLSRVSFIDEAGARPLLEAHRLISRRHGSLLIGGISLAAADFLDAHAAFADSLAPDPGGSPPSTAIQRKQWRG